MENKLLIDKADVSESKGALESINSILILLAVQDLASLNADRDCQVSSMKITVADELHLH